MSSLEDISVDVKEMILIDFCIKLDTYIKENNKRMSQNAINQVISSILGKPIYFKKSKKVKEIIPNDIPNDIPKGISKGNSKGNSKDIPEGNSKDIPEGNSKDIPEGNSKGNSKDIPKGILKDNKKGNKNKSIVFDENTNKKNFVVPSDDDDE
jgi:hypothetical protein